MIQDQRFWASHAATTSFHIAAVESSARRVAGSDLGMLRLSVGSQGFRLRLFEADLMSCHAMSCSVLQSNGIGNGNGNGNGNGGRNAKGNGSGHGNLN